MSARLTTAIRISASAKALLHKTKSFSDRDIMDQIDLKAHIGVEPMLLTLAMELALKAWIVFDHDDGSVIKSHNLTNLFGRLTPQSQQILDAQFKETVAPYHPSGLHIDYGIEDLLYQHQDAFVDWRYLHERKKSLNFDHGAFEATLEMVLREFDKKYRVEPL